MWNYFLSWYLKKLFEFVSWNFQNLSIKFCKRIWIKTYYVHLGKWILIDRVNFHMSQASIRHIVFLHIPRCNHICNQQLDQCNFHHCDKVLMHIHQSHPHNIVLHIHWDTKKGIKYLLEFEIFLIDILVRNSMKKEFEKM